MTIDTNRLINDKIFLELIDFKARRVSTFKKNLVELAELEIKHAEVNCRKYFYAININ